MLRASLRLVQIAAVLVAMGSTPAWSVMVMPAEHGHAVPAPASKGGDAVDQAAATADIRPVLYRPQCDGSQVVPAIGPVTARPQCAGQAPARLGADCFRPLPGDLVVPEPDWSMPRADEHPPLLPAVRADPPSAQGCLDAVPALRLAEQP